MNESIFNETYSLHAHKNYSNRRRNQTRKRMIMNEVSHRSIEN